MNGGGFSPVILIIMFIGEVMSLTNFPNGLSSFGVPVLPQIPFGTNSKVFFVDPVNGSDGNKGNSSSRPLKTLLKAHSLCTAGRNDVVYLIGNGATTGTARQDATLVWSKNATHLIGITAPGVNPRARIASTNGVNFTPLMTVSADGCVLANLSLFHGYDSATTQICLAVTGQRNVFSNCRISGMGHATAGDQAGSRSLTLSGDGENYFVGCYIGLDTIARSTTNAEIELLSQAVRNKFEKCTIESYADNAGHLFVKVGSGGMDRYCIFKDCEFINDGTSAMTAGLSVHASAGGKIYLTGTTFSDGCTDWTATDSSLVRLMMPAAEDSTSGLGVGVDVTP
jgi:hypothetical protein